MKVDSQFFLVTCSFVVNTLCAAQTFVAVTPLVGFENFFSKPWYTYYDNLSPKMRTDICAHVTGSAFFNTLKLDPLDPTDKGIFSILKGNYPNIYADLYEERTNSSAVLTNEYKKRMIVVEKRERPEFTFSCLAMDRETGNITQYFVSKVHLLNIDECRHHKDQMRGVFVFMEKDNETTVVAVAEQPGYVVNPSDTPYDFEFEVSDSTYEEQEVKHTICTLPTQEKIRLCTLVLNAETFRKEVTFVPDGENIEDDCYRGVMRLHRKIVIENSTESSSEDTSENSSKGSTENDKDSSTEKAANETRKNFTDDGIRNDWIMGCRAVKVADGQPVTYYVSAGFELNEQIFFCTEHKRGNVTMLGGIGCRMDIRKRVKYLEDEQMVKPEKY